MKRHPHIHLSRLAALLALLLPAYVQAQGLTPPALRQPADQDTISTPFPVFSWQPAFGGGPVNYAIRVVEVITGQSPEAAIESNPVLYGQQGLVATTTVYGLGAPVLLPGRTYAWQVLARVQEGPYAMSEVWEFFLKADTLSEEKQPDKYQYVHATATVGSRIYQTSNNVLPFFIDSGKAAYELKYTVYDTDGKKVKLPAQENMLLAYGENRFVLKLGALKAGSYTLELINRKTERYFIRFAK